MPASLARRAWLLVGAVSAAALIAGGTYLVVGLAAHDVEHVASEYPARGVRVVEVVSDDGSVTVTRSRRPRLAVAARLSIGLRAPRHDVRRRGDRLVVRGGCPGFAGRCGVGYAVEVTPGVDVVVRASEGSVSVQDVTGSVDIRADNGRVVANRIGGALTVHARNGGVRLADIDGALRAESRNGRIAAGGLRSPSVRAATRNGRVTLDFDRAPRSVSAGTRNGDVQVVVPDGPAAYAVSLDSANGRERLGVRADPDSPRRIDLGTRNGDAVVRYP
ncbi:MAG: DUF4097 family beta strand repeat-containing protein [Thermoleophilia bacterium]